MRVAILTAILGGDFDEAVDPVGQDLPGDISVTFHRYTDADFPPITGLTPRFQYRIPKMFGWQMFPGYDVYIWLDGSVSLRRPDCVQWYLDQLGDADMALFKHPVRRNIRQETAHIEEKLQQNHKYITPRYKNGLHKEQLEDIMSTGYEDDRLYTSTAFIYRDSEPLRDAMRLWWLHTSRYFTCDQIALPFAVQNLNVHMIPDNQYKIGYLSLVSNHK